MMSLNALNDSIAMFTASHEATNKYIVPHVPGLWIYENPKTTAIDTAIFYPVVSVTLQGEKETYLGDQTEFFRPGESLIVSHDLPVQSQITKATSAEPFRAIALDLDLTLLRSLRDEIDVPMPTDNNMDIIQRHPADAEFIQAIARYFQLHHKARDAKLLAPIMYRELHARILLAPHAGMLRRLLYRESHASQIARAIAHIRKYLAKPILIEDLADIAGMSVRSFHQHFKGITQTTPLQYQKELRLIEAKRLLQETKQTVGNTAFEVGYESPTQFSREYSRRFGVAPRTHLKEYQAR